MSTSTVDTTGTLQDLPVISEVVTYSVVLLNKDKKEEQGDKWEPEFKAMPEDSAKKYVEDNPEKAEIVFTQSFKSYNAKTDSGVVELCPEEEERVKMFNRGIDVKQQNKIRSLLLSRDEDGNFTFDQSEDAYDMRGHVAELTQTRGLSELEKILNKAKNLPPDQFAQFKTALGL